MLPMEYRPSEIARELGIHKDTVCRGWIPAGAPHRRDEHGNIWIVGTELVEWMSEILDKPKVKLGKDQAYCLSCQRAVTVNGPVTREPSKHAILVRGTCSICGVIVGRFVRDPSKEL